MRMPRQKGIPMDWDELKSKRTLTLTDTAWAGLESLAQKLEIKSKSDLIETIGRQVIPLAEAGITPEERQAIKKH